MALFKKGKKQEQNEALEPTPKTPKPKLGKEEREKRKRTKNLLSRSGESVPDQFIRNISDGLKKGLAYSKLSAAEKESYIFDDDFIDHRYGIYDKDGNPIGIHTLGLYLEGVPNIYNQRHEDSNSLIKAMRDSYLDSLRTTQNILAGTILLVPNLKTLHNLSDFMFISKAKPTQGEHYPLWLSVVDLNVEDINGEPYVPFKDLGPLPLDSYQDFSTSSDSDAEDEIDKPEELADAFMARAEVFAEMTGYALAKDETEESTGETGAQALNRIEESHQAAVEEPEQEETDATMVEEPTVEEPEPQPVETATENHTSAPETEEKAPMETEKTVEPDGFDGDVNPSSVVDPEELGEYPFDEDMLECNGSDEVDEEYGDAEEDTEYRPFPASSDSTQAVDTPADTVPADDADQVSGETPSFEVGAVASAPATYAPTGYVNRKTVPLAYDENQSTLLKTGELELDVVTDGFDQQILSMIPELGFDVFDEKAFAEITGVVIEPSARFTQQVNLVIGGYNTQRKALRQALESTMRQEFFEQVTALGQGILAEFDPEVEMEGRGDTAQNYIDALAAVAQIEEAREEKIPELVENRKKVIEESYTAERDKAAELAAEEARQTYDRINLDAHQNKLASVESEIRRHWSEEADNDRENARMIAQDAIESLYQAGHTELLGGFQEKLNSMIGAWAEENLKIQQEVIAHLQELVAAELDLSEQMKQAHATSTEVGDLESKIKSIEKAHEETLEAQKQEHIKAMADRDQESALMVNELQTKLASLRDDVKAEYEAKVAKALEDARLEREQYQAMAEVTKVASQSVNGTFAQNRETIETLNKTIDAQAAEIQSLRDNAKKEASEARRKDNWIWFTLLMIAMVTAFIIGMILF